MLQVDEPSYERVLSCCKEAIERIPDNAKAHYRCGVALFHLGHYDDAVASLQKAAQLQGKSGVYSMWSLILCFVRVLYLVALKLFACVFNTFLKNVYSYFTTTVDRHRI